jgi:hypothetical protein
MMNSNSRLLFAAARGARIQRLWFKHKDEPYNWETSRVIKAGADSDYDYRIHPADEHLQYGPISTALLWEAANYEPKKGLKHPTMREYTTAAVVANAIDGDFDTPMEDCDIVMYMLILAEALADEGL